jgi:CHAT domain-containing protein
MSSYSSSVKAIIEGSRRDVAGSQVPKEALLVDMSGTPDRMRLKYTAEEIKEVRRLCKSIKFRIAELETPLIKRNILSFLPTAAIFHFAGHGSTDADEPSRSNLVLDDWKTDSLTVGSLLDLNLHENSTFLAYHSACGTGELKKAKFLDESIHLISEHQLAGFRHVIGTLWSVDDYACVEMAKITYEEISKGEMTDHSVCLGLHIATRELRKN